MDDLGKVSIEFRTGFMRGANRIKACEMREPTVADQMASRAAAKTSPEQEMRLFASLCEISPDEINSLSMHDYGKLQEAYTDFLI